MRYQLDYSCITVLDPVPTTGLTTADAEELSNRVRDLMMHEIKDIGGGIGTHNNSPNESEKTK